MFNIFKKLFQKKEAILANPFSTQFSLLATKKEALEKLATLENPDTYEVVRNRQNGKIAKGWILRKRS